MTQSLLTCLVDPVRPATAEVAVSAEEVEQAFQAFSVLHQHNIIG